MIDFINEQQDANINIDTSDGQHLEDLVRFCKGWHKFASFVGACLQHSLGDEVTGHELYNRVRHEVENDGATLERVALLPGTDGSLSLEMEAYYA